MRQEALLELIYLLLPAYCANMAPPFVKFWRGWNRPIHRGWFGDHKTVVGFFSGVIAALPVAYLQAHVEMGIERPWRADVWLMVGLAQGLGAMTGDVVKSFFKRRVGIAPGARWIPLDQLDFAIGALIPMTFVVRLTWVHVVVMLLFTFVADVIVNHLSCYLGIRETSW